jgi:hypothetical protein
MDIYIRTADPDDIQVIGPFKDKAALEQFFGTQGRCFSSFVTVWTPEEWCALRARIDGEILCQ